MPWAPKWVFSFFTGFPGSSDIHQRQQLLGKQRCVYSINILGHLLCARIILDAGDTTVNKLDNKVPFFKELSF